MAFTWIKRAEEIFRDFITEGVPSSGRQAPVKADIRAYGSAIEDNLDALIGLGNHDFYTSFTNAISPTQLTANVNNYAPTGIDTASVVRLSSDAARNITGIVPPRSGSYLILFNIGTNNIVLSNDSSSSSAANRFAIGGNITIKPNEGAVIWYDPTSTRWRRPTDVPSSSAVIVSPAQITADQNNYAPAGLGSATVLRLSTDADGRTLTGMSAGSDGQMIEVHNIGTKTLVISDEGASSSAANRFALADGDVTVRPDQVILVQYDATSTRWRLAAQSRAGGMRGTVIMSRTVDSGNDPSVSPATWQVYKPDGSVLDVTGTTTQGLQEAITYCARYGYDLKVLGGGLKPQVYGVAYGGALGSNPFTTTNGSAVVTVHHVAHGFASGVKLTFWGGGAVRGIPESEFNAEHAITVVDVDNYTVALTTNATSGGTGGGSSARWQQSGQDVAIINCSTGLVFPPLQGVHWAIHATLNFGGGATTPALDFNSVMDSEISLYQQIVCSASYTHGVRFNPTNELPQDPNGPVVTSNKLFFHSIVMIGSGACVELNCANGPIIGNDFTFIEPNGGARGIDVTGLSASSQFRDNNIVCIGAHAQSTTGMRLGTTTSNAANIYGNTIRFVVYPDASSTGMEIYGSDNLIIFGIDSTEGVATLGCDLKSSSARNKVIPLMLNSTSTITDNGTNNWVFASNGIKNSFIIQMAAYRTKGNPTSGTADQADMTQAQLAMQLFVGATAKIRPSQITANQNDYAPTGNASANVWLLNSDATRNITGIAGGADGRPLLLVNVGTFAIALNDASSSSTLGNRFKFQSFGDVYLYPGQAAWLLWDTTANAWMLISVGHQIQVVGNLTSHGMLVAQGAGNPTAIAAMTDGQVPVGQTGADPIPKTISGDISLSAAGAATIPANTVTNAKSAQMAAYTTKGNTTNATANAADMTQVQLATQPYVGSTATITPAQITANQNNYNPSGLSGATVLRLSTDTTRSVTGLQGGTDGRLIQLINVGSFAVQLVDNSGSSSAANVFRFLGADYYIYPGDAVALRYDNTLTAWVLATGRVQIDLSTGAKGNLTASLVGGFTNAMTQKTAPVPSTDMVPGYDAVGTTGKKFAIENILQSGQGQPGMVAGRYHTGRLSNFGSGATLVMIANTLYAHPFFIGCKQTWTKCGIRVTAAAAAGKLARIGLYGVTSEGLPGALIADFGTLLVDATGNIEITGLSQTIEIGFYYLCIVSNDTPTITGWTANSNGDNLFTAIIGHGGPGAAIDAQLSRAFTFGVLSGATPYGTPTYTAVLAIPLIWMRF